MLNRLAKEWLPEFDALCQLLAVSAVVYADETSWSINSVWAFLSEHSRITVFGCRKNGETLAVLLKKEDFKGTFMFRWMRFFKPSLRLGSVWGREFC